jgi:small subunit ribosomal protein S16
MLVIRLARRGRKNRAFFELVVAEKARAVKKKTIQKLGYYDPHTEKGAGKFVFDAELVKKYIANGAQVSESVARKLKKAGVEEAAKFVPFRAAKPPKPAKTEEAAA